MERLGDQGNKEYFMEWKKKLNLYTEKSKDRDSKLVIPE